MCVIYREESFLAAAETGEGLLATGRGCGRGRGCRCRWSFRQSRPESPALTPITVPPSNDPGKQTPLRRQLRFAFNQVRCDESTYVTLLLARDTRYAIRDTFQLDECVDTFCCESKQVMKTKRRFVCIYGYSVSMAAGRWADRQIGRVAGGTSHTARPCTSRTGLRPEPSRASCGPKPARRQVGHVLPSRPPPRR